MHTLMKCKLVTKSSTKLIFLSYKASAVVVMEESPPSLIYSYKASIVVNMKLTSPHDTGL